MFVLGLESTCDETGVSIVRDGKTILANQVASQMQVHERYGGVVPELASRHHLDVFVPLLHEALKEASISLHDIDLIAVARGPGLIGALLVGLNFAKGLSFGLGKPLIGVNHVEAHLYAVMMNASVELPALGVVISGGHTALLLVKDIGNYQLIGQTHDDAIGEAFDKVATLLQLPYPGGPHIEKLAESGDPHRFPFKPGTVKGHPFSFSFSGLKTRVLYLVKGQNAGKTDALIISEEDKKDVAASFQYVAFSDLIQKSQLAAQEFGCKSLILGGGVSNNQYLRNLFAQKCELPLYWPAKGLCLDNAAMIAGLGYHTYLRQQQSDPLDLEALSRMPL